MHGKIHGMATTDKYIDHVTARAEAWSRLVLRCCFLVTRIYHSAGYVCFAVLYVPDIYAYICVYVYGWIQ